MGRSVFFRLKTLVASHTTVSEGLLGLHGAPCQPPLLSFLRLLFVRQAVRQAPQPLSSLLGLLCMLKAPPLAFPGLLLNLQALPSDFLSWDFFREGLRPSWVSPWTLAVIALFVLDGSHQASLGCHLM